MRSRWLSFLGWAFFAVLQALSQVPEYGVWGTVLLPQGRPAPHVPVTLANNNGFSREIYTDDNGQFEITQVPRGRYYLTASNPEDRDQVSDPAPVDLTRGLSSRVLFNLYLRSASARSAQQPKHAAGITVAEAAQRVPRQARKEFERGEARRARGEMAGALEAFDDAIRLFPSYFQALAARGHMRIALKMVPEAERDFARALELGGGYEPALRGAGMCEFEKRNYEGAVALFEKALLQDPRNASSNLFLGISLALLDRPEQARPALVKALTLDSLGAARAHVHLAYMLMRENRLEQAITELDAYLQKVPHAPDSGTFRELRRRLRSRTDPSDAGAAP